MKFIEKIKGSIEQRRETKKRKKEDLAKMSKEGRYEDIYRKYGRKVYQKYLDSAMYNDIKMERGIKFARIWLIKNEIKRLLQSIGIATTITTLTFPANIDIGNNVIRNKSYEDYKEQIDEYNEKISEYAKKIQSQNLSDIQIIMKVIDDMWKSIEGFKSPQEEVKGFLELNLSKQKGEWRYGVCRNMACDVARKLNEINPEYNARTLIIYLPDCTKLQQANIKKNILPEDEDISERDNIKSEYKGEKENEEKQKKHDPNHVIVLVDIKEDGFIMAIDPTNPSLGIYQNGEITMFNERNPEAVWEPKEFMSWRFVNYGEESALENMVNYARSFGNANINIHRLGSKYGVKAQNRALMQLRRKELAQKSSIKIPLANKINGAGNKKQSFKNVYRIEPEVLRQITKQSPKNKTRQELKNARRNRDGR